jgi:dolichol kinase
LTFFALLATLSFVILSDFIRVLWGTRYSIYNKLTGKVLRGKEYKAAGPQVYLIVGASFAYYLYVAGLYPVGVPMAGILVACFSDALAALIGRKLGKRTVTCPGGKVKTLEGFLAGIISAYLVAMIFVGPVLAIIAAAIFFVLDYVPNPVADNLSNPILISLGIWAVAALTSLPIGW